MPIRSIPGTKDSYYLVCFDADGTERKEPEGSFLTERLLKEATTTPVTDVFFLSHGWKGMSRRLLNSTTPGWERWLP
jgi:hypothetical protein